MDNHDYSMPQELNPIITNSDKMIANIIVFPHWGVTALVYSSSLAVPR